MVEKFMGLDDPGLGYFNCVCLHNGVSNCLSFRHVAISLKGEVPPLTNLSLFFLSFSISDLALINSIERFSTFQSRDPKEGILKASVKEVKECEESLDNPVWIDKYGRKI